MTFEIFSIPGCHNPVSCLSHLSAAPVFAVYGYSLVMRGRGNPIRTAGLLTLTFTSVFLLAMSGMYHLLGPGALRDLFRQLDIAGIFALIAGSATPCYIILFQGLHRWVPLAIIWTVAATGITLRTVFPESLQPAAANGIFLMMGWSGLIGICQLWRRFGFTFVKPLLWGGIAYTVGVLILTFKWPVLMPGIVGHHELWHFAVLAGLGLHWRFVFRIADGVVADEQPTLTGRGPHTLSMESTAIQEVAQVQEQVIPPHRKAA